MAVEEAQFSRPGWERLPPPTQSFPGISRLVATTGAGQAGLGSGVSTPCEWSSISSQVGSDIEVDALDDTLIRINTTGIYIVHADVQIAVANLANYLTRATATSTLLNPIAFVGLRDLSGAPNLHASIANLNLLRIAQITATTVFDIQALGAVTAAGQWTLDAILTIARLA